MPAIGTKLQRTLTRVMACRRPNGFLLLPGEKKNAGDNRARGHQTRSLETSLDSLTPCHLDKVALTDGGASKRPGLRTFSRRRRTTAERITRKPYRTLP